MNTVNNGLLTAAARYSAVAADTAESPDWHDARARHARALTEQDLYEECNASLLAAVRSGDVALVGRVFMAAVNARLSRAADREAYGRTFRSDAEDAAAEALHADLSPLLRASIALAEKQAPDVAREMADEADSDWRHA